MANKGSGNSTIAVQALRLAIADDHVLTRESLFAIISQRIRECELVAEASTPAEALVVCQHFTPDLLLLDVDIAGKSGVALVADIKRLTPATHVLLYCATVQEGDVLAAIRAGADGFLEKTCSRSDFLQAIQRVRDGNHYLCPRTVNALAKFLRRTDFQESKTQGQAKLTLREKEILVLIAAGDSSKEIAKKLFLSVSTVETHRANVMTKVGARNVAQLIQYGFQNGLIKLPSTAAVTT
jgi:DNA-binding NarL/FixJ family response regulator